MLKNKKFWLLEIIFFSLYLNILLLGDSSPSTTIGVFFIGLLLLIPGTVTSFFWNNLKNYGKIILSIINAMYSFNIIWFCCCTWKEMKDLYHGWEGFEIIIPALTILFCMVIYFIYYLILFFGKSVIPEYKILRKVITFFISILCIGSGFLIIILKNSI